MKVAIFGCLHGMLNEMFRAVENYEHKKNVTIDLVIVCGDCQTLRHYDDLNCIAVPNRYKKLGDFHEYYSGRKRVPRLTIFVGGNHEASNYLMTMPYGGWVCENFYYLGFAGVINYRNLRIAGLSGIYNHYSFNKGRFEMMPLDNSTLRSIYHTRQLDIFRLQLLSKSALKTKPIDVFMSHDWPAKIYEYGNCEQLLRFKPDFREDIESPNGLGSPATRPLVCQLRPRRWFAAHMHCRFYAKVKHDQESINQCTEFLSLNKIENRRFFMEVMEIEPAVKEVKEGLSCDDHNELYHDAEWLTILRKTIELESNSNKDVLLPKLESYQPSDEEIAHTVDLMNKTGGLKIPRNFQMSEPVIYDRPDGSNPSIDNRRRTFFPNPQHEELSTRLNLIRSDQLPQNFNQSHVGTSNDGSIRYNNNKTRSSGYDNNPKRQALCKHSEGLDSDLDGCLPYYVDTKSEGQK